MMSCTKECPSLGNSHNVFSLVKDSWNLKTSNCTEFHRFYYPERDLLDISSR